MSFAPRDRANDRNSDVEKCGKHQGSEEKFYDRIDAHTVNHRSLRAKLEQHQHRYTDVVSLTALLYADVAGSGLLAAWMIVRFPRHRPTSILRAMLLLVCALLCAQIVPPFIPALMRVSEGYYLVLVGCVLPVFFSMFLTSGWLLLAILSSGGSAGGGIRSRGRGGNADLADDSARHRARA